MFFKMTPDLILWFEGYYGTSTSTGLKHMTKKPAGTPTTISACDITVSEVNKASQIE